MSKKSPFNDLNGQIMVMAGHRYCLGRQTYVVPACIEYLMKWWDSFEANTKFVILRDTASAIMDDQAGSDFDKKAWLKFLEWGFIQLDNPTQYRLMNSLDYKNKPWPLNRGV